MRSRVSRRVSATILPALVVGALAWSPAMADDPPVPGAPRAPGSELPADYVPPVLEKARASSGIVEKTGRPIPGDVELIDSSGRTVRLGDYFDGSRPVIIQLAYYRCPKLCGEISKGMVRSMKALAEDLRIGRDFDVLTISFDSRESPELAAANKQAVVEVLSRVAPTQDVRDGWSFHVGDDANLKPLTEALGYRFGWIEEVQQYSHPAAIIVCTPDGTISRYLYGASYDPQTLRLSLIDASQGTISPSLTDMFVLNCFDYDPKLGRYTATAYTLMRLAGATTVITLAGVIGFLLIAEKRGKLRRLANAGTPAEDESARDAEDDDDEDGNNTAPPPRPPRTAFSG